MVRTINNVFAEAKKAREMSPGYRDQEVRHLVDWIYEFLTEYPEPLEIQSLEDDDMPF